MPHQASAHATSLKQKAIEELRAFWITAVYLALFLGAFTFYRRMLMAELGVPYLHYGIAALEALVIAKVVLIGRALGLDRGVNRGPLIVSVMLRSGIFAMLVLLFGVLEHTVEGMLHRKDWASIIRGLLEVGLNEAVARMIVLFISFVPFFALVEIGSILGQGRLVELFFSRRRAAAQDALA
jgi:hypothetical protein